MHDPLPPPAPMMALPLPLPPPATNLLLKTGEHQTGTDLMAAGSYNYIYSSKDFSRSYMYIIRFDMK